MYNYKKAAHINLAANICGYEPVNLGKPPRTDGILSDAYEGNPLEEIRDWVRKNYDDPDIRI